MDKKYYTYAHIRNDTKTVFYIGKGSGKRSHSKYERNNLWHKIVKKHGYTVEIICYWDTESEAFEHEKKLIKSYRENGTMLANFTEGGDGIPGYRHTEATKRQKSERMKYLWSDEKFAAKMILIRQQQWTEEARKNASTSSAKVWSAETKQKHSKKLKAAYSTLEMREVQANRNRAYRESEDGRKAFSNRIKRYWSSPDSQTEEAKRKRSEATKKSWETRRGKKSED
jgi:hypothetical protein